MSGRLTRAVVHALDRVVPKSKDPEHLQTGRRGEEDAYFYLRKLGYVMVARNWRSPRCKGELDLVGWDGEVLCFIEVKTRTTLDVKPAEAAVDAEKRSDLCVVAREYLRVLRSRSLKTSRAQRGSPIPATISEGNRAPSLRSGCHEEAAKLPKHRFDVLSIYYLQSSGKLPQFTLFKNSFPMD